MEKEIIEEIEEVVDTIAVQINGEFACQTLPLLDESKVIYATREELDEIGRTKKFDLERLMVVDYDNTKDSKINEIRTKISQLKQELSDTDYKAIKYLEGEMSLMDYQPVKILREGYRLQINNLEKELENLIK